MKLIIKKIPPTINKYIGRSNIWEYQKDKKEYHNIVRLSTIGVNPKFESCKIKVTYYFKDKRRHDPSNYDKFLLELVIEADTDDVVRAAVGLGAGVWGAVVVGLGACGVVAVE